MNILILEDEDDKYNNISASVEKVFNNRTINIQRCKDINSAMRAIGAGNIDLIIADLLVPQIQGQVEIDASAQLCDILEKQPSAKRAKWIVVSRFDNALAGARQIFSVHGVAIINYADEDRWRAALEACLNTIAGATQFDFVVFCALEKERKGFTHVHNATLGDTLSLGGLNCQHLSIQGYHGLCIRTPQMGLVDSAIACSRALEMFRPKAVAMSGICGGRSSEVAIGDLVIPETCWNYQSGKFTKGALIFEPVSVPIPNWVSTELAQLIDHEAVNTIYDDLTIGDEYSRGLCMQPMVSGSSVVADASMVDEIGLQHRKVAGIDMEMYSIFRAAWQFYDNQAVYFGAKTVVDLADKEKSDSYHANGCAISARFVALALVKILDRHLDKIS